MKRPLITVCVTTFNQVDHIADCVSSALEQQGPFDLEVLVGDDGSTDGTRGVLRALAAAYPQTMTVLEREANLGPSGNYQDLVRRASGDFIAHLDGDDFWLPSKLRRQLALFQEQPQVVAVYCNAYVVGRDQQPQGLFNRPHPATFDANYLLERGNFLNHSSLMYRQQARPCVTDVEGPFIDFMTHLRMTDVGLLGYVPAPLVGYRVDVVGSMTGSAPDSVRLMYWRVIEAAARRPHLVEATRDCVAHFLADRVIEACLQRSWTSAQAWITRAATLDATVRRGLWVHVLGRLARRLLTRIAALSSRRGQAPGNILFPR